MANKFDYPASIHHQHNYHTQADFERATGSCTERPPLTKRKSLCTPCAPRRRGNKNRPRTDCTRSHSQSRFGNTPERTCRSSNRSCPPGRCRRRSQRRPRGTAGRGRRSSRRGRKSSEGTQSRPRSKCKTRLHKCRRQAPENRSHSYKPASSRPARNCSYTDTCSTCQGSSNQRCRPGRHLLRPCTSRFRTERSSRRTRSWRGRPGRAWKRS